MRCLALVLALLVLPGCGPKAPPGYVASKNSQVFHLDTCSEGRNIKPDNLVRLASRDEAMKAHRPCDVCKP